MLHNAAVELYFENKKGAQEVALQYRVVLRGQKQERQDRQERQTHVVNFTLLLATFFFNRPPWRLVTRLATFSSSFWREVGGDNNTF